MDHKYTNGLIHETSPYLQQHAHNPVDWYPTEREDLRELLLPWESGQRSGM